MANSNNAGGAKIINPPNYLKAKVRISGSGEGIDMRAVARAEEAIKKLSVEFDSWLNDEVERLIEARKRVDAEGITGKAGEEFFRVAHDLKGQATTFGYPLVTATCASLCTMFDKLGNLEELPENVSGKFKQLADHHVDTVRALVAQNVKDTEHPVGRKLADELNSVTQQFITKYLPGK